MNGKNQMELVARIIMAYRKRRLDRPRITNGKVIEGYDEETFKKLKTYKGAEVLFIENLRKSVFSEGMYDFDLKTEDGYIALFEAKLLINDEEVPFEEIEEEIELGIPIKIPRSRLSSFEYSNNAYNLTLLIFESETKYAISSKRICLDDLTERVTLTMEQALDILHKSSKKS